jgi:hypothetical protein
MVYIIAVSELLIEQCTVHMWLGHLVSYLVVCNCVVCVCVCIYLGGGWGVEGDFWFSILCG